jgi:hypothetical protein
MVAFDTTPVAAEIQREVWRRLGAAGRVRTAMQMSEDIRSVTLAGLRTRHGSREAHALRAELIRLVYGVDVGTTRS